MMQSNANIYFAGHPVMAVSSIVRDLESSGCSNLLAHAKNRLDQHAVYSFLERGERDTLTTNGFDQRFLDSNLFRAHQGALLP